METKRILVTRFSALGDVAMVVPVLWNLTEQHPDVEVLFASQSFAKELVKGIPRVSFFEVDLKERHKGVWGLWRLSREIRSVGKFYAFADIHNVLRTKLLGFFLLFTIPNKSIINKGRKGKRALTRKNDKKKIQLTHSIERYNKVFYNLGFNVIIKPLTLTSSLGHFSKEEIKTLGEKNRIWIGVAPFAKHKGKVFPLDRMREAIKIITSKTDCTVILFGGGKEETSILRVWENELPNCISIASKFPLDGELRVMSKLDLMITMDSANMHLASLVGTKVISIWGATHPYAGFYGWRQNPEFALQIDDLECRPCSVFGNKPCYRKDYACMNEISAEMLANKVYAMLQTGS